MPTAGAKGKKTAKRTLVKAVEKKAVAPSASENLYTLDVCILGGPISKKFEGKTASRTIEILGTHSLDDLHETIFEAFGRWDEHLWEFQIGGKGLDDVNSQRYGSPGLGDEETKDASKTTLDSLKLKKGQPFGYIFDFGDNWGHQIRVIKIEATEKTLERPKVVKKVGKAPPQYPDVEEE